MDNIICYVPSIEQSTFWRQKIVIRYRFPPSGTLFFPSVGVVLSVLMLMLCCSDFTWVQCDWHLVRSWTDNLRRKNLKKKSFSRWVLDKSSFVYNWDFPPWHEAAWWLRWWWPNHGRCHQDHGGKWGWPEKETLQHPRSWLVNLSLEPCAWQRQRRQRDLAFLSELVPSLWAEIQKAEMRKLVEDEMIGIMGFRWKEF